MKLYFAAATLLAATVSQADIIKCSFTEPFVDSTYSMSQSTLTYKNFGEKDRVFKNVSMQIKGPGEFALISSDGKVLQSLSLNNQGSDGMSDTVFPYDVKDTNMGSMANNGFGGCTSNLLKAKNQNN